MDNFAVGVESLEHMTSVSLNDREMYIGMQTTSPDVLVENVATARR